MMWPVLTRPVARTHRHWRHAHHLGSGERPFDRGCVPMPQMGEPTFLAQPTVAAVLGTSATRPRC